jgi:trans-aconitate methyltransferase
MGYRLYTDLAAWWPHLAERESHGLEAHLIQSLLDEAAGSRVESILEMGSGGGLLASHFDGDREVVLSDISSEMLAQCRIHNPDRTCHKADMRTMRLSRTFSAVLLHDAVMYLTSLEDLQAAFHSAAAHLDPGGVFMVLPDVVKERFEEMCVGGGSTGIPAAQLLEWHWDPDPSDSSYQLELSILLKDEQGNIEAVHESHTLGLFSSQTYVQCLRAAGLEVIGGLIWDENVAPEVFCARKL